MKSSKYRSRALVHTYMKHQDAEKKHDPNYLYCDIAVYTRWIPLIISETAELLGFSHTAVSGVYAGWYYYNNNNNDNKNHN